MFGDRMTGHPACGIVASGRFPQAAAGRRAGSVGQRDCCARPVANAAEAATTGDPSFTLINRSKRVLKDFYASPAGDQNWGPSRLGSGTLAPGAKIPVILPGGECRYDLRLVWLGGEARDLRGVNTCAFHEYNAR
jgi:hypothetical protein